MFDFDIFSNIPPVGHLYFFYGLAFLFLGLSILSKDIKASDLKLAGSLWLLAGFGFTHGTHEWIELYVLLQKPYISVNEILWLKILTVSIVVISFLFLLQFGISLVCSIDKRRMKWLRGVPFILFLFMVVYLWNYGFRMDVLFFQKADNLSRNTFALVGGILTAYGLMTYSREIKSLNLSVSRKIFYAGLSFVFYGIFAGIIPSRSVIPYLKIPVEILRGISAVFITYFIMKALNIFDIETKKKMEQQLKQLAQSEKLVSLGQLAAGIAHEINNPLTNISLHTQILKDELEESSNPEAKKRLDAIEKNVFKASTIAKELLQFSRKTDTEVSPINITSVINGAITLMQYRFRDINVHKRFSEVPDIMGDPVKLEQVFINILDNSVESMTNDGEICIETTFDRGWVNIRISDSGTGIPKENLSKIFDPFFSTKDVGMGTGLGLSICYGIITQHNGSIYISSVPDEGTIVSIRLPGADGKE